MFSAPFQRPIMFLMFGRRSVIPGKYAILSNRCPGWRRFQRLNNQPRRSRCKRSTHEGSNSSDQEPETSSRPMGTSHSQRRQKRPARFQQRTFRPGTLEDDRGEPDEQRRNRLADLLDRFRHHVQQRQGGAYNPGRLFHQLPRNRPQGTPPGDRPLIPRAERLEKSGLDLLPKVRRLTTVCMGSVRYAVSESAPVLSTPPAHLPKIPEQLRNVVEPHRPQNVPLELELDPSSTALRSLVAVPSVFNQHLELGNVAALPHLKELVINPQHHGRLTERHT